MNLEELTLEELETEQARLQAAAAELRTRRRAVAAELDDRRANLALAQDMARLEQKHGATIQQLYPKGIQSTAAVGTPG